MLIHVPSPQSGASGICTKPSTNATRFLSLCSSSRRANSCEVPWGDGNGSPGCGPWDRTSEFSGDLICDLGILGDQQYVWFNKFYVCPIGSTWFAPFLLDENQWKNHWLSSTKISNHRILAQQLQQCSWIPAGPTVPPNRHLPTKPDDQVAVQCPNPWDWPRKWWSSAPNDPSVPSRCWENWPFLLDQHDPCGSRGDAGRAKGKMAIPK